jgi:arylsulfatase A-like enzyme
MITRLDGYVGRILDQLKQLHLDRRTLVIFTSDNGPHKESGNDPDFFKSSGPLRGLKRDLTEGGIRVPFVVWWPGVIGGGREAKHVGYFGDFLATAAELAGTAAPSNLDSISLVPTLLGRRGQKQHEFLYFEFHEKGFSSAALLDGRWKGIRMETTNAPIELYDLKRDTGEKLNVAAQHPKIVARVASCLATARSASAEWPIKPPPKKMDRERASGPSVQ